MKMLDKFVIGEDFIQIKKGEGLTCNVTLQQFRRYLFDNGYTEIRTIYRAGKHIVEYFKGKLTRGQLIDAGYVKPTKEEKKLIAKGVVIK